MQVDENTPAPESQQQGRPYMFVALFILTLLVMLIAGLLLRDNKPDFYDPGRAAIVNARMHLEESLGLEQALIEQQRMAHAEINKAIAQLDKAETLDAEDYSRIEQVRQQLLAIEKADSQREENPGELHKQYKDILDQMESLISRLQNHHQ